MRPRLGKDYPSGGRVNEKRGNTGRRLAAVLYEGGEGMTVSGLKSTDWWSIRDVVGCCEDICGSMGVILR